MDRRKLFDRQRILAPFLFLFHSPYTLWVVLAWPSFPLILDLFQDNRYYAEIMHLTGVLSVQLLVITLGITPMVQFFKTVGKGQNIGLWLLKRRRYFGVACFGYALLHLIFYVRETNNLTVIYLEIFDLSFTFGWLGFLLLMPPFFTSNTTSIKRLGPHWKSVQRASYFAVIAIFIHWLYFDFFWDEALTWAAVLIALRGAHLGYVWMKTKKKQTKRPSASLPL